jgi:hypothetical protein
MYQSLSQDLYYALYDTKETVHKTPIYNLKNEDNRIKDERIHRNPKEQCLHSDLERT